MIKRTIYFGNPAYLHLRDSQLAFHLLETRDFKIISEKNNNKERTIPIEDIGYLVLDNKQITITQGLLDALMANGSCVVTCGENHMPTGLFLPLDANTLQSERCQAQISCSLPLKKQLWQQTVKAKIANQAYVLSHFSKVESGNMYRWVEEVKSNDSKNLEARAAAYYWKNIFNGRNDFIRDPFGCYPNSLLNYGYAILRAVIARALVCKGLMPIFGIHHHNRYNAYCLADDIMEPYRPYVDVVVLGLCEKYGDTDSLNLEIKKQLLTIPVIEVNIDGHRSPLMVAAETTASSLLRCYEGVSKKIIYPKM